MGDGMKKTLLKGTLFLTITAFIAKLLSLVYKIPYQNITGDLGFYVYQTVYPLFSMVTLFATYSIPLVTSESIIQKRIGSLSYYRKRIVSHFWFIAFILLLFSPMIAKGFNDSNFQGFIVLLSILLLVIPFQGIDRGVLYANEKSIYKVGISNLIEQSVRVLFIGLSLYLFSRYERMNHYQVAQFSYVALLLGCFSSFFYLRWTKKEPIVCHHERKERAIVKGSIKRMWLLTLSASLLLLMHLMDGLTITHHLKGVSLKEAQQLKGVYDRGLPIIQGALFFVSPFIGSYTPYLKKYNKPYRELVEMVLLIALPATVGLVIVFPELNQRLFNDLQATNILRLNLLIVVLYGVLLTYMAIPSNANTKHNYSLIFLTIGLKVGLNVIFLPRVGLIGAVYSNLLSLTFLLISYMVMNRYSVRLSVKNVLKIGIAALMMGGIVYACGTLPVTYPIILQVMVGVFVYIVIILLLNPLNIRDELKIMINSWG